MKKLILMVLAAAMALSLFGCGARTEAPGAPDTQPVDTQPADNGVTAEDLVGAWRPAEEGNDMEKIHEVFPASAEFGGSMEIHGDGQMTWFLGAEGGTGTYVLEGSAVRMSGTSDLDGSPMEVTFTVEGQGAERLLAMEVDGVTVLWEQGEAADRPAGTEDAE